MFAPEEALSVKLGGGVKVAADHRRTKHKHGGKGKQGGRKKLSLAAKPLELGAGERVAVDLKPRGKRGRDALRKAIKRHAGPKVRIFASVLDPDGKRSRQAISFRIR